MGSLVSLHYDVHLRSLHTSAKSDGLVVVWLLRHMDYKPLTVPHISPSLRLALPLALPCVLALI